MPHDLTPVETEDEFNENPTNLFEPTPKAGAPEPDNVMDPVSYEVPLLPPIPIPHQESGKRVAVPYPR